MCKFSVSVQVSNVDEAVEAERRLLQMKGSGTVTMGQRSRDIVVAHFDHPNISGGQLKIAGWAKDAFGMHPRLLPAVALL